MEDGAGKTDRHMLRHITDPRPEGLPVASPHIGQATARRLSAIP
jgi:hypothetical protein